MQASGSGATLLGKCPESCTGVSDNPHEDAHDLQHAAVERWERRWLAVSGLLSLMFIMLIAYALTVEGAHIGQLSSNGRGQPEVLLSSALFENPGVRTAGMNEYQVSVVAQTYSFNPPEVVLPRGAHVTFFATSRDVLHGYQIENTNINVELIPGEVATFEYTFDTLGTYRVGCNEYCGIGHQNMVAQIRVVNPSELAQARAAGGNAAGGVEVGADTTSSGGAVYSSNCASCHGPDGLGVAGAFPPLVEHVGHLYNADRDYLPHLILYGLQGPIEVAGQTYNGQMPAWKQLGDDEIAEVLNYTLSRWGNEAVTEGFEPYTAEDVAPFRNEDLAPEEVYQLHRQLDLP